MFNRSAKSRSRLHATRAAIAAGILLSGATLSAGDDDFPARGGFNPRDDVTGYLCVTPGCDVLRLPGNECLCTKDNPAETRLSRLKLSCYKSENWRWVACPVQPTYEWKLR